MCLSLSSIPSLIILKARTNIKGAHAENGVKGDISSILYKIAIIRKYIFAYLLNC